MFLQRRATRALFLLLAASSAACGDAGTARCAFASDECGKIGGAADGGARADGGPGDGGAFVPAAPSNPLQAPTTRASGLHSPYALALDDASIYFTNFDEGTVYKVPRGGGAPVELARGTPPALGIALDGQRVYFVSGPYPNTQLRSVSSGGGDVATHGPCRPDYSIHRLVAFDATYIYWVDAGESELAGAIYRATKAGGEPQAIATALRGPESLAVDDTNVYWLQADDYANAGDGSLHSMPKGGGSIRDLGAAGFTPGELVERGEHLYWAARSPSLGVGSLRRIAKTGGHTTTITAAEGVFRFALVEGWIYFALADGIVRRVPADGSTAPISIAVSVGITNGISADRSDVFFTVGASDPHARDGQLLRVAP